MASDGTGRAGGADDPLALGFATGHPSTATQVVPAAKDAFAWALSRTYLLVVGLMVASFLVVFLLHTRGKPSSAGPAVTGPAG